MGLELDMPLHRIRDDKSHTDPSHMQSACSCVQRGPIFPVAKFHRGSFSREIFKFWHIEGKMLKQHCNWANAVECTLPNFLAQCLCQKCGHSPRAMLSLVLALLGHLQVLGTALEPSGQERH